MPEPKAARKQAKEPKEKPQAELEPAAQPEPGRPRTLVNRWLTLLVVLMALFVVYSVVRDILYRRVIYGLAQQTLNLFATGAVEKMGAVDLTGEGNILVRDALVTHLHRGKKRVFYRAERIEIALDGWPIRENPVYVSRVDLFHPEIWIVRESGGDWNLLWAFQPPPKGADEPPEAPPPPPVAVPPPPHPARGGWPRNGVHVHQGIIHVTFAREDASEVTWDITNVNAVMERANPGIHIGPFRGEFYGGTMTADMSITSYSPFRMNMQASVKGAEAARFVEGKPFMKRPIRGRLDGVLALTYDRENIGGLPVCAGRIEINDGDLWDLPPFVGVLAAFALTNVGDRKLKAAHIEFTVERDIVRITQMDFLGQPVCLFGDGTMALTGEKLDITLVPRIGKSMADVLPIVGLPIQWLLNLLKGAIIPVKITGAFWAPQFLVGGHDVLSEPVKKLIEEKSPK